MREYKLREERPGKFVWVDPATGNPFGSATPEQVSSWLKGKQAAEVFAKPERQSSWSVVRTARAELLWLLWAIALAGMLILLMLVLNTLA